MKRYDIEDIGKYESHYTMVESSDGEYVTYEHLEKAVELLKAILLAVKLRAINAEFTETEIEQFLNDMEE